MSELILGSRCSGKTTELIKKSAETGAPIMVRTGSQANLVYDTAKQMGLFIPFPITVRQVLSPLNNFNNRDVLIDEGETILQEVFSRHNIKAITWTKKEVTDLGKKIDPTVEKLTRLFYDWVSNTNRTGYVNKKEQAKPDNDAKRVFNKLLQNWCDAKGYTCYNVWLSDKSGTNYRFSNYKRSCDYIIEDSAFYNISVGELYKRVVEFVKTQFKKENNMTERDLKDRLDALNYYSHDIDTNRLVYDKFWAITPKNPFEIKNVIFNNPATIVFWKDGTKSVVKCGEGEQYDPEKGLAMAISKKALGNKHEYYNTFKRWMKKCPSAKKLSVAEAICNVGKAAQDLDKALTKATSAINRNEKCKYESEDDGRKMCYGVKEPEPCTNYSNCPGYVPDK